MSRKAVGAIALLTAVAGGLAAPGAAQASVPPPALACPAGFAPGIVLSGGRLAQACVAVVSTVVPPGAGSAAGSAHGTAAGSASGTVRQAVHGARHRLAPAAHRPAPAARPAARPITRWTATPATPTTGATMLTPVTG